MPSPNPATRYSHPGAALITTLSAGITSTSTSFSITSSSGWPDGTGGSFFVVIDQGITGKEEKVLVSSRSGTTCTVAGGVAGRGQDGTTATDHDANGGPVYPCITAEEIDDLNEHAASSSAVHGAAGAVVGTTDAQTLTNKSLTSPAIAGGALSGTFSGSPTFSDNPVFSGAPVIANFTSMQHDHGDADDGGLLVTAAPTASAVGDTVVTGTAASYSRTDHKHAREAFGSPGNSATADTASDGVATTVARSDHRHGREAVQTVQVFTSSGTWTKPAGLKRVRVRLVGGGGGGGGSVSTGAGQISTGSGGEGGGYSESWIGTGSLSASETVTVGAGGAGNLGADGSVGGTTSFAGSVSAAGGAPGLAMSASSANAGSGGGDSAQSITGDYTSNGQAGGGAFHGPGSGGISGHGGSSVLGGGGAGRGSDGAGNAARGYGGGGGGALTPASTGGHTGGAGKGGVVIVEEFY